MYILGLHSDGEYFKVCLLHRKGKKIRIEFLKEFKKNITNLNVLKKILDKKLSFLNPSVEVVSALSSDEVYIKKLIIPFGSLRKVKKALDFKLSSDELYQDSDRYFVPSYKKMGNETVVTLYGYTKEAMESHLQEVKTLGIDSEWISTVTRAFERFVKYFTPVDRAFFLFHLGWETSFLFFVDNQEISKEVSFTFGLKDVIDAVQKEQVDLDNFDMQIMQDIFFKTLEDGKEGAIRDVFFEFEREISRAWTYMVENHKKAKEASCILFTGYGEFSAQLKEHLPPIDLTEIHMTPHLDYTNAQLKSYAVEIGLALDRALSDSQSLQLAKGEFLPTIQKVKAKKDLTRYGLVSIMGIAMFFFTVDAYFIKKKSTLRHRYKNAVAEIYDLQNKKCPNISFRDKSLKLMRKKLALMVKKQKEKTKLGEGPQGMVSVINWLQLCVGKEFALERFDYFISESPGIDGASDYVLSLEVALRKGENTENFDGLLGRLSQSKGEISYIEEPQFEVCDDEMTVRVKVKA